MATTLRDIYGKTNKSNVKTLRDVYGGKTEQTISSYQDSKEVKKDYNKGGLLEGIGYTLGKVGTGAFGVLEGIWDYAAGGIADILGADEWAEKQFATNLTGNWNQDLDEWYNPSGGMKLVGDVSSGIGSTLVGVAAGALTGGTAAPVVAGVTMGVGAAGSATSEAYQKTGTLGGKEYLYGALSGATEGALESATGVAGKVSARLFAKETAKSLAKKSALKGIFSTIASDFAGEAFEEGMSEFLTPIYQRITQVDPNAKNATIQEIGYSALVGGLSGALMSGIGEGISTVQAINRGNEISKNPEYAKRVVSTAEQFANASNEVKSKSSLYSYMDGLVAEYNARANSTGELSLQQKKVLAQMERAIPVLTLEPTIAKSKAKILADADRFVEYVNARNIVDQTNGKVIKLENGEALKNNEALLTQFAVMDAVGSLLMDSDSVYSVVTQNKNGEILQEDYINFQKNATTQQKSALKEIFGVDVDSTSYEDFIAATKKTNKSAIANIQGGIEARASAKRAISRVNNTNEKVDVFNEKSLVDDGTKVYKTNDGKIYAVTKNGEGYYLYNGKDISKKLSKEQLIQAINALNGEIKGKEESSKTPQKSKGKSKTKESSKSKETSKNKANKQEKTKNDKSKEELERNRALITDFANYMRDYVKREGGWSTKAVTDYVEAHKELDFISRIYDKDETVKTDLEKYLSSVNDIEVLEVFSWYLGGAYADKGRTWDKMTGKAAYPYRGAVRTFRNAVSKRMQEIGQGTNLGIKNGSVDLDYVEALFNKLNKNPDIGTLSKKVFTTARKLGVNIRFANKVISKNRVGGDNVGDMVEYKTSYFNDATVSDQRKASTLVHELIHACTVYVMHYETGTYSIGNISNKDANYIKLANCATRLNAIYEEIKSDPDFSDSYGIKNAKEMVAELANEKFVGLMKKKNLWQRILDAICNLFGFSRGTTAYDNAMACLDYMLDNPDVKAYREYAKSQREAMKAEGYDVFGSVLEVDGQSMSESEMRDNIANGIDISENLAYAKEHKQDILKNYNDKGATQSYASIVGKYNKILKIWERLGGEINSKFLNEWNNKQGKDRIFTVFKEQAGYKYNIELSSMCKKGVPLFEAIDTIVKKEVMQELGLKTLGKNEKEILYDILKSHHFEIPCAICYVEQARQREGTVINTFLEGKIETTTKGEVKTHKLGWNQVLNDVQSEMKKNGVDYVFPKMDRSIATDTHSAKSFDMDEKTQDAFYAALKTLANNEILRYNKEKGKNRPLIKTISPDSIKKALGGNVGANLKLFKVLFQNPNSRFTIDGDLLYSSMTTQNLASWHNALYGLFNQQGGVSTYKTKQTPIVYWGDILKKKWESNKIRKEGGIRNQSNSDFQMYTLLDQAQMYIDFTAKGYYLQAYTKVIPELKLFGLSNGKINASLIPRVLVYKLANGEVDVAKTMENAGLDENGNPIYDDFEGIPHEEAFMLIEDGDYSKNITGVCIGYSDNHIQKLLDDSRVQLIIGFHDKTNVGEKRYRGAKYAKNYNGLNEAVDNATNETKHVGFNQFVQKAEGMFGYDAESGKTDRNKVYHNGKLYDVNEIPNLAADLYLQMCKGKNYTPAYNAFKDHLNYYKLLADFGLKDSKGRYAPHKKVSYNMPDTVPYLDENGKKQYLSTEEYIKTELEKELAVRDSISEALADTSANGIIPQFKKEIERRRESKVDISNQEIDTDKDFYLIDKYDEKQYNDFGWARVNGVLSYRENGNFRAKYREITSNTQTEIHTTANGEIIVETNDMAEEKFGVNNVLVFAKGSYEDYQITRVIRINLFNETDIEDVRGYIYERESSRASTSIVVENIFEEKLVREYRNSDFENYQGIKRQGQEGTNNSRNDRNIENGARNSAKVKESRRLKPIDKDYLEAVDNGYTKIAQAMVDEAAKTAGYTIKAYHHTENAFRVFDLSKARRNMDIQGFYFSADKDAESEYGSIRYDTYLKMENPYIVDSKETANKIPFDLSKEDAGVIAREWLQEQGYDSVIRRADYYGAEADEYIVFNSNQIKSSKPITYDEDGKVIPLSKRFDVLKVDINFEETTPIKGADKVMTELPNDKVTLKDVISGNATKEQLKTQIKGGFAEQTEAFKVTMTNAQASVERVAEENGIKDATAQTNYIRAGKYAAQNAIEEMGGQYNLEGDERLGDSLGKILKPIYKANEKDGKTYADFELYLLHWHNIERYEAGKPVFNRVNAPIEEQVTSEDSKKAIAELDKKYPNFKKVAEKVWKFNDNNLQLSVESGMYSQEYADNLREMYPHYVPTFREEHATKAAALMGKNNVWVNNAKKAAKGSSAKILPIDDMMAAQTIQKTTSARINSLLVKMLEQGNHEEFKVIATEDANIQIDDDTQVTTYEDKAKNTHQVTFYHNGKKVTAQVSRLVFKGIDNFRPSADMSDNVLINTTKKLNTWFKKGVTSLNPFFSFFKNPIRDMQDALLYTKYGVRTFLKNYKRARKEIANNGKYWQEAKAAGITSSSVYDYQKGIEYKQTGVGAKAKQFASKIENASNAIEMSPRLAEYISAREAGLSVKEALLQAQDVTTNFGRGGEFAKKLNSTISPFLNPAIQGFSKMWRAYTGEDGKKAWISLIIKSLILGIGATALNDILNDDDEDYENLSDYVKEQNYVIAIGDGNFLKLPKGRVAGVFGSAFLRGKRYSEGEEEAWEDYLSTIVSSVTPVENFTRTIFSPITDAQTNTTWYGGTIESQKWNDTEPKNRYDESTSKISIWLGSVFNYSPLKIDYLLEQYTGIVGDLVLPATSTQAESGIITQNMLANSTTNSKWSTNFYSTLEKYTYKKTSGDLKAKGVVRYLNSINSTISDMYNQQRTIQADKSIADSEKLTQSKIIQATINTLMQEAIGNAKYIYDELGKYNLSTDDAFERSYLDCISVVMGEEYALQTYNKDVYAKATKLNKLGVDYATYYDFYFDVKDIASDKNNDGSTIAGSKKAKVINYVMSQTLSTAQKLVLIMAQGYTIADGDVKGMTAKQAKTTVAKYITSLNLTREEKTELSEMLGFTVKNGKILLT